jgi:hypothetical protein
VKPSPIEAGVVSRMEMLPVGGNFEGDEMGSKKDLMVWGDFSMMIKELTSNLRNIGRR